MKNVVKLLNLLLLASCVLFISCEKNVTGVSLSEKILSMEMEEVVNLTAVVTPDNAADKSVTWMSSAESIVTVDNGKLTAVGLGTAKITVTTNDGNFTDECEVTVTEKIDDEYTVYPVIAFIVDNMELPSSTTSILSIPSYPGKHTFDNRRLTVYVNNTSGKKIPKGTTLKFRLRANGSPLEIRGEDGSAMTMVVKKIQDDIPINGRMPLHSINPFELVTGMYILGDNSLCVDVFQMGKKEYSVPETRYLYYKVEIQ